MRWVTSVAGQAFGNHFLRLGLALAVAAPVAMAQQGGNGGPGHPNHDGASGYNRNSNAPSAPRFTSTFGPQSVVVPGRGELRRGAPEYAFSWGIVQRTGREHEGDHRRDRDRHRSGFAAYPIYNPWALMPWDYGYLDANGYPTEDNGAEPSPQGGEAMPPQHEQYGRSYPSAETDYAPPPPRTATEAAPPTSSAPAPAASPAPVSGEPALTLIFKDGRHQSVRNYAVTRNSVIVLDDAASGRQKRIPLAELDLGATKQAAELAGLDFNPPA